LGPIKYVADVVYGTQDRDLIDKAVRLVIFVIIVVFDPLAILLLIAANQTYRKQKKPKKGAKVIDVPAPSSVESFIDTKSQIVPKDKILNMTGELK
jgi:cell division protein YceG involved in septum cleavage